jgi:hypothetical protein
MGLDCSPQPQPVTAAVGRSSDSLVTELRRSAHRRHSMCRARPFATPSLAVASATCALTVSAAIPSDRAAGVSMSCTPPIPGLRACSLERLDHHRAQQQATGSTAGCTYGGGGHDAAAPAFS